MDQKSNDKLIKLLNESEDGFVSKFVYYDELNRTFELDNWQSLHYTLILSKEYCFIKRLVENNKIDKYKVIELEHNWIRPFKLDNLYWEIKLEERLIMLLSIQDDPVECLVSILN